MGLLQELQQGRVRKSDSSRGGSCSYDIHDREWMLEHTAHGHPVRVSMWSLGRCQERLVLTTGGLGIKRGLASLE
jgi:hypothetical protein